MRNASSTSVRCFDKAETAKGRRPAQFDTPPGTPATPPPVPPRMAPDATRTVAQARRLDFDAKLFVQSPSFTDSTWELRRQGVRSPAHAAGWARAIYHLCKHRAFTGTSKAEEAKADSDAEGDGSKRTRKIRRRAREKGYRSAAEMVLAEFLRPAQQGRAIRQGAITCCWVMKWHCFASQRRFGNPRTPASVSEVLIPGAATAAAACSGSKARAGRCRPSQDAWQMHV